MDNNIYIKGNYAVKDLSIIATHYGNIEASEYGCFKPYTPQTSMLIRISKTLNMEWFDRFEQEGIEYIKLNNNGKAELKRRLKKAFPSTI